MSPLILFVFSVFFSTLLSAAVLNTDNFDTDLDGWSGTGISQGTYSGITRMRIDSQRTATKSFNFGSTLANQTLTITFRGYSYPTWEGDDALETTPGTPSSFVLSYLNNPQEYTFTATANANGDITLILYTNTNDENAYIDWIRIEGTPVVGPPVIPGDTFSIDEDANNGDTVGTVSTTGGVPTSFTILSGNDDGIFQISAAGVITIANNTNLDYETTRSYSLSVRADNANGEGTAGNIRIDINNIDETAPVVTDEAFSINKDANNGDTVGTVSATANPTSFTILSGNDDGIFQISAAGVITIADNSNIDYETTRSYSLNVEATNAYGTGTGTITININSETIFNGQERPFTIRNPQDTRNLPGDVQVIGNSNQCVTSSTRNFDSACTPSRSTTANDNMTKYLNIDSGTSGIFNATEATLALDANRTVVWAGLYWQGFMHECSSQTGDYENRCRFRDGTAPTSNSIDLSTNSYDTNKVRFKTSSAGSYQDVQAVELDYLYSSAAEGTIYSAYADVTDLLNTTNPNETYSVANIQSMEGRRGYGNYAAWALFVIYKYDGPGDPFNQEKSRNISVYDGFEIVKGYGSNERVTITPSGFRTPDEGTVDSKLISFAGEGEYAFTPDFIKVNGNKLSNADNPSDNAYNSSISGFTRNPSWANANGIDIDIFDASAYIPNKATSATITIGSDMDHFYQSVLAFSTELYIPKLCYDYTLDINGHIIDSINNQIKTPFGGFGKPLTSHLYLRSTEKGDLDLVDVSVSYRHLDISQLTYIQDSTMISETGKYSYVDATFLTTYQGDPGFDMNIGAGASGSNGGTIGAGEDRYIKLDSKFETDKVNTSFTFDVNYKVDFGSGGVPYEQRFNVEDLCPADSGGFLPELGFFNIVDGGAPHDIYNLYTQVSKRPFYLTVYAYDADTPTDLYANDLNLSVEVEIIRADNFSRNADVACHDEHSLLSEDSVKFAYFSDSKRADVFFEADDLNLSYRSAAMRVWYLTDVDGNGTLSVEHNCTRNNQSACHTLYVRDYNSDTECGAECAQNSSGCYDCLRSTYGRMVCSRDNFAIRPESFVTNIMDSNQSADIDKTIVNIANSIYPSTPFSVIAGYKYRFDINATNHVDNKATPRYIQHFEPGSATHRVRMVPIPSFKNNVYCNDVEDQNISINLFNGSSVNDHNRTSYVDKVSQIGEYQFEIFDSNWTSADWDPAQMSHHYEGNYTSNYLQTEDCLFNDSNVPITGNVGCEISSVHTNQNTEVEYVYLDARYYPYTFNVSGLNIGAGPGNTSSFVYINTLNRTLYPNGVDENMSYNIQDTFYAAGYTGTIVNNFVDKCYSDDVDMTLQHAYLSDIPTNGTHDLRADLIDHNTTNPSKTYPNNVPADRRRIPFSNTLTKNVITGLTITQASDLFVQDMQGAITMDLGYNFDRAINQELNPRRINFSDFNITYNAATLPSTIYVDLIEDYKIFGNRHIVDQNITFLYARAKPAQTYYETIENNIDTPVSVVVFCSLGYTECQDRGIMALMAQTNESDWWKSWDHNNIAPEKDGNIELVSSPATALNRTTTSISSAGEDKLVNVSRPSDPPVIVPVNLVVNDPADYTDRWLIYNPESATVIPSPFYRVKFLGASGWAGHGDTGHVVGGQSSSKTNRRLEW